jgi:hypothetical protein
MVSRVRRFVSKSTLFTSVSLGGTKTYELNSRLTNPPYTDLSERLSAIWEKSDDELSI